MANSPTWGMDNWIHKAHYEPFGMDEDGYIPLPEGLGLGIELDEDQLEDKLGHDWNYPKTYDADDGSVVNW
jgi:galactonate dehydratase